MAEISAAIPVMSLNFEAMLKSKQAMRQKLAARPIAEKLRILDALRERALAIRSANVSRTGMIREETNHYGLTKRDE